jgi:hypothetical protein
MGRQACVDNGGNRVRKGQGRWLSGLKGSECDEAEEGTRLSTAHSLCDATRTPSDGEEGDWQEVLTFLCFDPVRGGAT